MCYSMCFNRAYADAKQCAKKVIQSECKIPSEMQTLLNVTFSDYDPFCANNLVPGAARKGQCYGVKDLNNPFNKPSTPAAAIGVKGSVLQGLLFPILLLLFFVKV